MSRACKHDHFAGKEVFEHLKEARKKGLKAFESIHGIEPSGALVAAADAAKEVAVVLSLFTILLVPLQLDSLFLLLYPMLMVFFGFLIWKTCRSALWGWSRLERVHRLIAEEKWEIDHHREQEKEELRELYQAKGFKNKQLDEVVEVLMADDNRLLQVMLEEELGLSLGSFEHPLRQALGAFIGTLLSGILCLIAMAVNSHIGILFALGIIVCISSILTAKILRNHIVKHLVWNIAIIFTTLAATYFLYITIFNFFLPA